MAKLLAQEAIMTVTKRDILRLTRAWFVEGPCPAYHRQEKLRLIVRWPALYNAVADIAYRNKNLVEKPLSFNQAVDEKMAELALPTPDAVQALEQIGITTGDERCLTFSNCARCGETHQNFSASRLDNHDEYTHWGVCPTTGQPVLITARQMPG